MAFQRFLESLEIDYESWHDGIGFDLDALDEMTSEDRDKIVDILKNFNESNAWRNLEALRHINTSKAVRAIKSALYHHSLQVRISASRFASGAEKEREHILIEALENAEIYRGLSQALDQIETFHPEGVIDALLRGVLNRNSEAVNFAGMLYFIFGKADTSFDWDNRPFFLRFNTDSRSDKEKAFVEFCNIIEVDSKKYLNK